MAQKQQYTIMYSTGRIDHMWYVEPADMKNMSWLLWVRRSMGQITHIEDIISPDGTSVLPEYFDPLMV